MSKRVVVEGSKDIKLSPSEPWSVVAWCASRRRAALAVPGLDGKATVLGVLLASARKHAHSDNGIGHVCSSQSKRSHWTCGSLVDNAHVGDASSRSMGILQGCAVCVHLVKDGLM